MTKASRTTKTALRISNVKDIIRNQVLRRMFLFCYEGDTGKGYYVMGDRHLTEKEFNQEFPILAIPIRDKGINPDSTKFE